MHVMRQILNANETLFMSRLVRVNAPCVSYIASSRLMKLVYLMWPGLLKRVKLMWFS